MLPSYGCTIEEVLTSVCFSFCSICRDKEWVAAEIRRIFTSCFYFDVEFKLRLSKVRPVYLAAAFAISTSLLLAVEIRDR